MLNFALIALGLATVSGIVYQVFIAPKTWMKKYGDGCYNQYVKFNKKHLGIKKGE